MLSLPRDLINVPLGNVDEQGHIDSWSPVLRLFQRHQGLVINGLWSTFVSRQVHAVLAENGRELRQVTAGCSTLLGATVLDRVFVLKGQYSAFDLRALNGGICPDDVMSTMSVAETLSAICRARSASHRLSIGAALPSRLVLLGHPVAHSLSPRFQNGQGWIAVGRTGGSGEAGLKLLKRNVDQTKDNYQSHAWGGGAFAISPDAFSFSSRSSVNRNRSSTIPECAPGGYARMSPNPRSNVTSIRRSRLDTITSAFAPAVALGNLVIFEKNTIRGAAGVGLAVLGTSGVSLLGGRIELVSAPGAGSTFSVIVPRQLPEGRHGA